MFGPSAISRVRELQEFEMSQCLKCSLSLLIVYFISDSRLVFFYFTSFENPEAKLNRYHIRYRAEVPENQMTLRDTTKKRGVKIVM